MTCARKRGEREGQREVKGRRQTHGSEVFRLASVTAQTKCALSPISEGLWLVTPMVEKREDARKMFSRAPAREECYQVRTDLIDGLARQRTVHSPRQTCQ